MRVAPLLVALATLAATPARAAPDEMILALEGGYGLLTRGDARPSGAGGHGTAWVGLTDTFWLAGSGGVTGFPGLEDRAVLWEAFGGLAAALDIFRAVPFAEAMIGVVGAGDVLSPSVRLGLGLDYLVTRTLSVGAVARWRPLSDELGGHLVTAQVRLALRLDL